MQKGFIHKIGMAIRLSKAGRELNVGISTLVEFLHKKGYTVDGNPNTKIDDEQYSLLVKEFSKDKSLKDEARRQGQVRQITEKRRAADAVQEEKAETKATKTHKGEEPAEGARPAEKAVEKPAVESDATPQAETPEPPVQVQEPETPVAEVTPAEPEEHKPEAETQEPEVAHTDTEAPAEPEPEAEAAQAEEKPLPEKEENAPTTAPAQDAEEEAKPAEAETKANDDGIYRLDHSDQGPKLTVIGRIDVDGINQTTRPPKKTKADRQKERENKDKERIIKQNLFRESLMSEIRAGGANTSTAAKPGTKTGSSNGKKARTRINKSTERVNLSNPQGYPSSEAGKTSANGKDRSGDKPGRLTNGATKQDTAGEDFTQQVKENLARLSAKTKSKSAKYRKEKREQASENRRAQATREEAERRTLKLTEFVTANELASMMDVPVTKVISTCMSVGIMVSINQRLDAETIDFVAGEHGFDTEYVGVEVAQAIEEEPDAEEDLLPRAPIVTVMGHVDHGKTSLLDYIRKSNVIAGEAGGITQHIGAYNVKLDDGRRITFLDTPGHEAFTAMRARGAKVTDIAIIIVAADDSVMPQTKEAINHAMAANVPIVFAINKIDKPGANPEKIKEELAAMNFLVEEWGGKYQSQDISAKKGIGVQELLEKVLLEADILELKANPNRRATGSIIESSLDRGRGYVATVLVSNGTLKTGDILLAGTNYGRIKAMFNERNQRITEAAPAEPALVLGLNGAPAAGDAFHVIETEQEARELASKREQLQREQGLRTQKMLTLDEVGRRLALGDFHELNIIVKGDVDGSVEALSDSLIKLSTEQIQVNVIHKGVGQISESDVSLAAASGAIIVGFQVRPSGAAAKQAEQEGVDIRKYSVIYDAIGEVKDAMAGMLAPTVKEQVTATLDVREVFNISKVGMVAGAMVKTGKIKRSDKIRLIRDGIVVFTGSINALKRFKDDVKEVGTNFECGISLVGCNDIKPGDVIESFEEVEVRQTL